MSNQYEDNEDRADRMALPEEREAPPVRPDDVDELRKLEAAFEANGGRGVELAERIDELRAKVGPQPEPLEDEPPEPDLDAGPIEQSPAYRSAMHDAGRGHLLP